MLAPTITKPQGRAVSIAQLPYTVPTRPHAPRYIHDNALNTHRAANSNFWRFAFRAPAARIRGRFWLGLSLATRAALTLTLDDIRCVKHLPATFILPHFLCSVAACRKLLALMQIIADALSKWSCSWAT